MTNPQVSGSRTFPRVKWASGKGEMQIITYPKTPRLIGPTRTSQEVRAEAAVLLLQGARPVLPWSAIGAAIRKLENAAAMQAGCIITAEQQPPMPKELAARWAEVESELATLDAWEAV